MTVTLEDIDTWSPEDISEVFYACGSNASTCKNGASTLGDLNVFHDWEGEASGAARAAVANTERQYQIHEVVNKRIKVAADDAKSEVEHIKERLEEIREDASRFGFSIDNATSTVSAPVDNSVVSAGRALVGSPFTPPGVRVLAFGPQAVLESAEAYEAKLQQRVNELLKDAFNVDDDIAVAILAAIGAVPPHTVNDPNANATEILDRRDNQIEAFSNQFGRPPTTTTDFITAEALDPHTYSDKTQGAQSEVSVTPITPVPGQGVVRTNLFIPSEKVQNVSTDPSRILSGQGLPDNLGDNRSADAKANAEDSRVSIYVDYENGVVIARQNPTVTSDNSDRPRAGTPDVTATQDSQGQVSIDYSAIDTFQPDIATATGVDVQGEITVAPNENGDANVNALVTEYPSAEIYQYKPGGNVSTLGVHNATMDETGPMFGLPWGPNTRITN